ncbi:hydrolase 2, exosortase A system-associated [Massilia yuzhufengensis]|uniref:Exosortase A system-associated hydrolase 2 n=1 Tax=Massilia yuzhufengensis TaxID=1164594 RepID=A0A1I1DJM6_9BURK|nr:hydrolase 2, exosortase A system-associated [Massilia yuzhufengensis]SFB74646.1 exosortase A system-associated hydrolase 2 [Massilia yuzhufengensis]
MNPSAEPFFLDAEPGQRFCLFHPPAGACRGALLYVHPFGDEMNKARRMAALTARALAARGYGVLQLDLYGCGDSSGDFADARWETWLADLEAASAWLHARLEVPVGLWGLRLGGLLALEFAQRSARAVPDIVLWQPVQQGGAFLKQFLRLLSVNEMLAQPEADPNKAASNTGMLRTTLLGGQALEVAGYELAPQLAAAIDSLDAARLAPAASRVHWFEMISAPDRPLAPALARLADKWRTQGCDLRLQQVTGPAFWATQEISESDALTDATCAALDAVPVHCREAA